MEEARRLFAMGLRDVLRTSTWSAVLAYIEHGLSHGGDEVHGHAMWSPCVI